MSKAVIDVNWLCVEDYPLYVEVGDEIEIKEDPSEGIIVAFRVYNETYRTGYWCMERCRIDEEGGLVVMYNDGDEESLGWNVQDVEYWQPFPKPPFKFEYI